jgi:hypothetical protein
VDKRRASLMILSLIVALATVIALKARRAPRLRAGSGDSDPPCMASHFGLPCR